MPEKTVRIAVNFMMLDAGSFFQDELIFVS